MAFIDNDSLETLVRNAPVDAHPLLSVPGISLPTRISYFNGCVFATLVDDSRVSDEEKNLLYKIGRALMLSDDQLEDGLSLGQKLTTESDKNDFLKELVAELRPRKIADLFLLDLEELLFDGARLKPGAEVFWKSFGVMLIGAEWSRVSRIRERKRFCSFAYGGVFSYPGIAISAVKRVTKSVARSQAWEALCGYMGRTNLCHYWRKAVRNVRYFLRRA